MSIVFPAVIYIFGALLIPFFSGKSRKYFMLAVATLGLVNIILISPQNSWEYSFIGFNLIFLHADKLSLIVGYIFGTIGLLGVIYSLNAEENELHPSAFLYMGSSMGAVFAGDFLTLYIFWEIMAVSSTVIVWARHDKEATTIGFRYLMMHIIGGLFFLAGIVTQYSSTGTLAVTASPSGISMFFFFIGIGINAGFIPLHTWLPDAYPTAPLAGSVFMSVYTTKTAVYMLARVLPGVEAVGFMGAIMAVYGVSFALMQNNARRLLSYHIISQVGYMVAAIGLGGEMGINGGIFHLLNHIFYKALLFMCIGAVLYRTGKEELTELGGLTKKMPITTICISIASLSISGMALFNGFVSKAMIFEAAHGSDFIYLMLELAAVGTFLSFLKITYFGFFRQNKEIEASDITDPPLNMIIPMVVTSFFCVIIGVFPGLVTNILPHSVPDDFHFYSVGHIIGVICLLGTTAGIFIGLKKYYSPHDRVILDFDLFYKKIFLGFKEFCTETISAFAEMVDTLVTFFFVHIWLPVSNEKSLYKKIDDKAISIIGGEPIVDKFLAKKFLNYCENAGKIDKTIVDDMIVDSGRFVKKLSNILRWIQTGYVQNYLLFMAFGLFAIISIFLIFL